MLLNGVQSKIPLEHVDGELHVHVCVHVHETCLKEAFNFVVFFISFGMKSVMFAILGVAIKLNSNGVVSVSYYACTRTCMYCMIVTVFCCVHVCLADQSRQRREVVRRKTAEYLNHAEELYQKHLADDEEDKVQITDILSVTPSF